MGLNKIVDFPTAKLLKEKEFDEPTRDCYNINGFLFSNGWCEYINDDQEFDGLIMPEKLKEKDTLAPTIAEVIMWLYDNCDIWIEVNLGDHGFFWTLMKERNIVAESKYGIYFDSPTKAYEAAIEYVLNNSI